MAITRFEGHHCSVVLDTVLRTVTMEHSGALTLGAKKKASPRVIAFDDIEAVEYKHSNLGADRFG
ncbi:hypothetical protein GTV32_23050 [Gordonia sp. SID5947]|uniref:hypothetical protein n=1 Tax=Gordonia sp. SID5947 TaxID=2690315 RepID=UPI0013693340|nr:hypothetical protein [Gordonia sp. SID5947]MYR08956.1 hypothetical protein [Gordonia sp. SID5947]MYR09012.1 hypothetical protein [Gordonia sp. SID5947]